MTLIMQSMMKENNCKPNMVLYTAMIGALAKGKQYEKLTEIYSEMVKEQVFPNVVTFNTLMKTLYEAGNLDAAFEIFKKMQRMKIHPSPPIYGLFMEGGGGVHMQRQVTLTW
jgi:pentatricopeptide repeat protein